MKGPTASTACFWQPAARPASYSLSTPPPPTRRQVTKPVVAWVSGTCAKLFKSEVQFGHAGARGGGAEAESAQAKNAALRAAGAAVPESFEGFEGAIRETYERLVAEGVIVPAPDMEVPTIPMDLEPAMKAGKVGAARRALMGL
jgi:ATP citrate (pro-S)-lyase